MTAEILSFETGRPADIAEGEPALVVDVGGYEGPLDLLLTLARLPCWQGRQLPVRLRPCRHALPPT